MFESRSRGVVCAGLILAGALAVFWPSRWVESAPMPERGDLNAPPRGLVVVIESKPQRPLDLAAMENPNISGVALQIHWAELEPAEGKPTWSKLDALMGRAEKSARWVHLLIFPGFFSPAWALDGVETITFPLQYGPGKGTAAALPVPWDAQYLHRWLEFVRLVGERYGNSPALTLVAADGPTSVSAEETLPHAPDEIGQWQAHGYRPSKYMDAWTMVFGAYARDFPRQYISLSAGAGQINLNEQGKRDARQPLRTRRAVVDVGESALGRRFVLQLSDVHAGPGPFEPNSENEDRFLIAYNGQMITGFQMRTSAERDSRVMGAEGNPPLALKKSVEMAMEPDEQGRRVKYLEIYEPDVVAEEMQVELKAAAGFFGR